MKLDRLLVWLKPQFIGDAVMAMPILDGLIADGRKPIVYASPLIQDVLGDRRQNVEFTDGKKLSGIGPVLNEAKRLRAMNLDAVILINRSFRSALAARLARIPIRVGHQTEGRGFLLSHKLRYDPAKNEAECYLDLSRLLGLNYPWIPPKIAVSPDEAVAGLKWLQGATVGIQPGARYAEKQVPASVMAEVANALVNSGYKLALLGGKDEIEAAERFQGLLTQPAVNIVGKTSMRGSLGALSQLKVMIGSDTGLMHLACASGIGTVTVFGPNPASKWGHTWGENRVLEAPQGRIGDVTAEQILDLALPLL